MDPIVIFTIVLIFVLLVIFWLLKIIFRNSILFIFAAVMLMMQALTVWLAYFVGFTGKLIHLVWAFPLGGGITIGGYAFLNKKIRVLGVD